MSDKEGVPRTSDAAALYRLMAWLSPAYPVGAFSYSSGIEWAVEAGDITDATTLQRWLTATIGNGGGFCDAAHPRPCLPRNGRQRRSGAEGCRGARRGAGSVEGALPRNDRARARFHRSHPGGVALRRAQPVGGDLGRSARLSGRGRDWPRPATTFRWRAPSPRSCTRSRPISFPRASGWCRSARPTASACSHRSNP